MAKTVKIQHIGGPEGLGIVEGPIPEPGENEVVVKIHTIGLNRAELLFMQGQYIVLPKIPSPIGFEASGTVHQVGLGVTGIQKNAPVSVLPNFMPTEYGVIGEYAVVPKQAVIAKPAELSFNDAAAFWMAYGSAYAGLIFRGGLENGDGKTVLITAASSSVGVAAIRMATYLGAKVIATTRTSAKKDFLLAQGANHVIATDDESLADAVQEYTEGKGFHIGLDPVAGPMINELANAGAPEAKIVVYGSLATEQSTLPLYQLLLKGISIQGFHLVFHVLRFPDRVHAMLEFMLDGLKASALHPVINRKFMSLDHIQEAYAYMASNQQKGKIILEL